METKVEKPKLRMIGAPICDTCKHRDECPEDFKEEHLIIRVIESEDGSGCFGGYYCWGIPYNTIPFHKGIDWYWQYKYEKSQSENKASQLPDFPKVEEDFIIITDDNES
jgi:hypothetical protein